MDSRKPLTMERIEELRHSLSTPSADGNVWLDEVTSPEELLCLLSTLTPPPGAAVQQASYELRKFIDSAPSATDARLIKNLETVLRALYEGTLYRHDICKIATILGIQYHMTQRVATFVDTVREWSASYDRAISRATRAEARVRELEAFKASVMAWARGRCGACEHECSEGDTCYDCNSDDERSNWTPPQAWEVGE